MGWPPWRLGPLGGGGQAHVLEFAVRRVGSGGRRLSGRPADVHTALLSACRLQFSILGPAAKRPMRLDQEFLKRLASERPAAEEFGRWRLYRWGEGRPIVIGTCRIGFQPVARDTAGGASNVDEDGRAEAHPTSGPSLAEPAYRVVIWGMALPAAKNAWTLYMFQSGGGGGENRPKVEIPLPPGGHRLVSIRAAGGDAITAYSADDGDAARMFYDRWFADHGWTAAAGWQPIASVGMSALRLRSRRPALAADIRLGSDPQGRWTGLVMESQVP